MLIVRRSSMTDLRGSGMVCRPGGLQLLLLRLVLRLLLLLRRLSTHSTVSEGSRGGLHMNYQSLQQAGTHGLSCSWPCVRNRISWPT